MSFVIENFLLFHSFLMNAFSNLPLISFLCYFQFPQHGCFGGKKKDGTRIHVDCSDAKARGEILTPLPESFKHLTLTDDMDKQWFDLIKDFKTEGRPMK